MKKINKISYILLGMVLMFIIGTATPAFADTVEVIKQLTAQFTYNGKPISLYTNGVKIAKDADGNDVQLFIVGDDVYAPIKTISDALGKSITWNNEYASVIIENIYMNMPGSIENPDAKLTTKIDDDGKRIDSLDYKFTLDEDAVGEWKMFHWYNNISDFTPALTPIQNFAWTGNSVYADGTWKMNVTQDEVVNRGTLRWTKGYFMNTSAMKGIPAYSINTIDDRTFMILEWKSGDYTSNGKVSYYVFEKVSDTPFPRGAN